MNENADQDRRTMETFLRVENMASDISEIKGTMKEMSTAINKLAIVEERQAQDRGAMDRLFKGQVAHDIRIKALEQAQPLQQQTTDWFSRVIWVVIGAVLAAVLSLVVVDRSGIKAPRTSLATSPQESRA